MSDYNTGEQDVCCNCGRPVVYNGKYWNHDDGSFACKGEFHKAAKIEPKELIISDLQLRYPNAKIIIYNEHFDQEFVLTRSDYSIDENGNIRISVE